jgi:archaemetzincin
MFSIQHCTAYECNMCGSNHRAESDRHPLYLCPECHAKVCWATNAEPVARLRRLAEFCRQHGLEQERAYFVSATDRMSPFAQQPP